MSGRVYYNKLIRDKIPEKMTKKGDEYEVREIADDQEFEQELLKKVAEEAHAVSTVRDRGDLIDELADLYEVLDALAAFQKISPDELEAARALNQEKKGGFTKRFFLRWSEDSGYRSNETPQGIEQGTNKEN